MNAEKEPAKGIAVGFVMVLDESRTRFDAPAGDFVLTIEAARKRLEFHDAGTMFDAHVPGGKRYFTIIRRDDNSEEEVSGASRTDKVGDRYVERFCSKCGGATWFRENEVTPESAPYECGACCGGGRIVAFAAGR